MVKRPRLKRSHTPKCVLTHHDVTETAERDGLSRRCFELFLHGFFWRIFHDKRIGPTFERELLLLYEGHFPMNLAAHRVEKTVYWFDRFPTTTFTLALQRVCWATVLQCTPWELYIQMRRSNQIAFGQQVEVQVSTGLPPDSPICPPPFLPLCPFSRRFRFQ